MELFKDCFVYDDFISDKDFKALATALLDNKHQVPYRWDYSPEVVGEQDVMCDELDHYQLSNTMYFMHAKEYWDKDKNKGKRPEAYKTSHFPLLFPIFDNPKLKFGVPMRVKANLNLRTKEIVRHGFHCDNPLPMAHTAIFYMNDCNGYTEFEKTGDKVYSKANRLCVFPTQTRHSGTTCTDQKRRVVININFMPDKQDGKDPRAIG